MKIYLDIFFLVNMAMNGVVLMLESFLQNRRIRLGYLCLAAAAGGVLSVIFLLMGIHRFPWLSFPLYIAGSGGIVRLAFGRTTVAAWIRNLLVFLLSAAVLSGILTWLQGMVRQQGSMVFLLSGAFGILYLAYRLAPVGRRAGEGQADRCAVCLGYAGGKIHGMGLRDTGNHLSDPFSHQPVSVAERIFVEPLWENQKPVLRYIPFHTVGTRQGMIPIFQAEYLEVRQGGELVRRERPWIAISDNALSVDGEYEMILHPDMTMKK